MDEEEQRRQASAAAFGQTASAGYENPSTAIQMNRQRGLGNAPTPEGEQMAAAQDNVGEARLINNVIRGGSSFDPRIEAAYQSDPGSSAAVWQNAHSVPGASEAFGQLDAAMPADPTQFDERMAEGTQEGVGEVLRQSFDENLRAARDAVAGQVRRASGATVATGATGGSDGEIAQYRDRLLKMADKALSQPMDKIKAPSYKESDFFAPATAEKEIPLDKNGVPDDGGDIFDDWDV